MTEQLNITLINKIYGSILGIKFKSHINIAFAFTYLPNGGGRDAHDFYTHIKLTPNRNIEIIFEMSDLKLFLNKS